MRVTYKRGSSEVFAHVSLISLHLAFTLLMIHSSLLFLHGHFKSTPDYGLTDLRHPQVLAVL